MTLPAIIPTASCPTTARHAVTLAAECQRLDGGYKLDRYDRLVDLPDLRKVEAELATAMQPAAAEHAAKWARTLVDCFPAKGSFRDERHAAVYARGLAMDLAEFPADVVERTVHEMRRAGGAFVPGAGDVYKHAQGIMDERRRLHRAAKAQIAEHDRRWAEAAKPKPVPYKDQTPEQRAEFDAMMAALKAGGGVKRIPADREPGPADIERARAQALADAAALMAQEAAE